jgi:hypothetical protein
VGRPWSGFAAGRNWGARQGLRRWGIDDMPRPVLAAFQKRSVSANHAPALLIRSIPTTVSLKCSTKQCRQIKQICSAAQKRDSCSAEKSKGNTSLDCASVAAAEIAPSEASLGQGRHQVKDWPVLKWVSGLRQAGDRPSGNRGHHPLPPKLSPC